MSSDKDRTAFPGIVRNEPMVSPPSPPHYDIPAVFRNSSIKSIGPLELSPNMSSILSPKSISIITSDRTQSATDRDYVEWTWNCRRQAQSITDYLYLGPHSIIRDQAFMAKHGFTMILMIRDQKLAKLGFMAAERLMNATDTVVDFVDVSSPQDLFAAFPLSVQKINTHLLSRHEAGQKVDLDGHGKFSPGKVLVCCETGNERSAAIVAAYLMAVYDANLVRAVQFISFKRFCATFDENTCGLLKSWEELILAKGMVMKETAGYMGAEPAGGVKRSFVETVDKDDMEVSMTGVHSPLDSERFVERHYSPFADMEDASSKMRDD
jgi:serine/threonine/tyrosine-interacting protein